MKFYQLSEVIYKKYKDENIFRMVSSSTEKFDSGTEIRELEEKMSNSILSLYDTYNSLYKDADIKLYPKDKEFQMHSYYKDTIEIFVLKIIETEIIL